MKKYVLNYNKREIFSQATKEKAKENLYEIKKGAWILANELINSSILTIETKKELGSKIQNILFYLYKDLEIEEKGDK